MATANAIHAAYDERLAPLGLTLSQASLLSYVCDYGPVTQTRAAEHLGQGRAVTGNHVDKLEALAMLERRPDPDDRRVWLVAITEAGRELASSIADVDRVLRAELRDGISRADRQTLASLLLRLQHNLHRSTRPTGPDGSTTPQNEPTGPDGSTTPQNEPTGPDGSTTPQNEPTGPNGSTNPQGAPS